jgi:hypothetical protein
VAARAACHVARSAVLPRSLNWPDAICVTSRKKGDVTYTLFRSDGAKVIDDTLTFTRAGSKRVSRTWTLEEGESADYAGWAAIELLDADLEPIVTSNKAHFKIHCK